MTMTPKELIEKVARKADTSPKKSNITVTDVSRVYSLIIHELAALPSEELLTFVGKAVSKAKVDRKKAKAKGKK